MFCQCSRKIIITGFSRYKKTTGNEIEIANVRSNSIKTRIIRDIKCNNSHNTFITSQEFYEYLFYYKLLKLPISDSFWSKIKYENVFKSKGIYVFITVWWITVDAFNQKITGCAQS